MRWVLERSGDISSLSDNPRGLGRYKPSPEDAVVKDVSAVGVSGHAYKGEESTIIVDRRRSHHVVGHSSRH